MAAEQLQFFGQEDPGDQSRKRKIVSIPLDTLVLSSVALVLLLVLFFSLGVEKGKRNAFIALERDKDTAPQLQTSELQVPLRRSATVGAVSAQPVAAVPIEPAKPTLVAVPVVATPEETFSAGKYSVQIASFQRESAANDEARRLQRKGFSVTVLKKGKFSVVCVGAFDEYKEAQKQCETLKKTYKDCFIRRL